MKTLGRILIILAAFAIVMGMTYVVVNAISSSNASPAFTQGGEEVARPASLQAPFPNGGRPDFDRDGPGGSGGMFGLVKNIGIVAVVVGLIVVPKGMLRRRAIPVRVT